MTFNKKYNNTIIRFFSTELNPFITYNDSLLYKLNVQKENKNKSGIYRWVNNINNKSYVGSSVNLYSRLTNYYSIKYLNRSVLRGNSLIYRALLLHGHNNFNLEILEYCDRKFVIDREQYYLDLLKPEYNILNKAGSNSVFKQSRETLLKLKDPELDAEGLTKWNLHGIN